MIKTIRNNKYGLALGGGAVLGAAHIGVLRALDEKNITISCISGTSIGAFTAALFAFGKSWNEIEKIALDLSWFQTARLKLSKYAIFSNEKLGESLKKMIGSPQFSDAQIPLAIIATDICTGEAAVLKSGSVIDAVMASTSLPVIFEPVKIDGRLLVDGGVAENVPVSVLPEMGAKTIIGVDLIRNHVHRNPENMIEIMLNSFHFTVLNSLKHVTGKADIIIAPPLQGYNAVDTDQIPDLIDIGYKEAKKMLESALNSF